MKLISLNTEGGKHWKLTDPFLDAEAADVICFQEVLKEDAMREAVARGMHSAFAPMFLRRDTITGVPKEEGVAILSRLPLSHISTEEYHTPNQDIQIIDENDDRTVESTVRRVVLSGTVITEGKSFTIATTHFTWTPDGLPRDYQYAAAEKMLTVLEKFSEVALCGDFNAPRSVNDLYGRLTEKYYDAIPLHYASSLDLTIHRIKENPAQAERLAKYMVDYLFLSKGYTAQGVRLQAGVSDHYAIVATLDIAA